MSSEENYFQVVFNPNEFTYKPTDNVVLIDGDGSENFPNLSLQKISAWEKRNGVQHIELIKLRHQRKKGKLGLHQESLDEIKRIKNYNRIYASFIFTRSKPVIQLLKELLPNVYVGGTGSDEYYEMQEGDLRSQPKRISQLHPLIENMYPDHELYESEHADLNVRFWSSPDEFKYVKKYKEYIDNYLITPVDGIWGGVTSESNNTDKDIINKFNNKLINNGYKDGAEYRGSTRGNGYSSKGCPRKCTFCVVPVIQGDLKPQHYGLLGVINWVLPKDYYPNMDEIVTLYKNNKLKMRPHLFWDNKGEKVNRISAFLTISDNNFPADPTCLEKMDYLIENDIAVNLNQGMDARLLTVKSRIDKQGIRHPSGDEICEKLSKLSFMNYKGTAKQMHFSWDFLSVGRIVIDGISKLVNEYGLRYSNFCIYCLSGFNTTFEEDLQRVMTLRKLGADPYVMLFRNVDGSEGTKFDGSPQDWRMKHLSRWVNNKIIWRKTTFENYENYVKELKKRNKGNWNDEHEQMAKIECFDWLTEDYINHA